MYENTEPWDKSVPDDLLVAVKHLRDSFDRVHWGCGRTTERFCYAVLHGEEVDDPTMEYIDYLTHMKVQVGPAATQRFSKLIKQRTPPALFKAFFHLYLDALTVEALRIFHELAEAGRANQNKLPIPHLEWTEAQVQHLIRSDCHQARTWIQNVCDRQPYDPTDDSDELFLWRKWQAPSFIVMKPSRHRAYDAALLWSRNDAETSQRWLDSFARDYVFHLESRVNGAAGEAALELAKQPSAANGNSERVVPGLPPPLSRREESKQFTKARNSKLKREYGELKKDKPNMSDVWYSQQIFKNQSGDRKFRSANTIKKLMKK